MSSLKDRGSLVSTAVDNTSLWVRGHNWQAIYGKTSRAVFTTDSARKEPKMEFGLYTFADVGPRIDPARRLHNLLEEIELADELDLDVFGVGEHHRPDYAISSPAVALAAAAARTRNIRLTSAVTVLSSDDPVRVFQDFATLDLISDGRAEIMAGRGSFIESFPLFGYDLGDYDQLFSEKLELLLKVRASERVTWSGKHCAPLEDAGVYPRPLQDPLPVWIAVGGTPQSVVRAALLGLPLAIAIIGGQPEHFAPLTRLYREAARRAGHDPARLPVGINSHTYVAASAAGRRWGAGNSRWVVRPTERSLSAARRRSYRRSSSSTSSSDTGALWRRSA